MDELKSLANILAHWIEPAPGVTVYLFGSRVRGTHHSCSDVDVRIFLNECVWCEKSMVWWTLQNESGFC
jgi:predicted nucleotidyltransferase